jgi:hypothetical protein
VLVASFLVLVVLVRACIRINDRLIESSVSPLNSSTRAATAASGSNGGGCAAAIGPKAVNETQIDSRSRMAIPLPTTRVCRSQRRKVSSAR